MSNWKYIDSPHAITHIQDVDECIFARVYKAGQGYSAGDTNQLIFNFRKDPRRKGTNEWQYREAAVKQFAQEFALLFKTA